MTTAAEIEAEILAWRDRADAADQAGEPLYVTPAEFAELRRLVAAPETWLPVGESPAVLGTPVVVRPATGADPGGPAARTL